MSLPSWMEVPGGHWKVLEPGEWVTDEQTLEMFLVEAFAGIGKRRELWDKFKMLRRFAAGELGVVGVQWVDGSFVEEKCEPGDIDVVTFVDGDWIERLDDATFERVTQLLKGGKDTISAWGTHTFLQQSWPSDHPQWKLFAERAPSWRRDWGRTPERDAPRGFKDTWQPTEKGFFVLPLGAGEQVETILTRLEATR